MESSKMTIATHVQQLLRVLVSSNKVIAFLFLFLETTSLIYFTSFGRKLQDTLDYSKNSASRNQVNPICFLPNPLSLLHGLSMKDSGLLQD